jgi:outer membrane protein assembly factor BamB
MLSALLVRIGLIKFVLLLPLLAATSSLVLAQTGANRHTVAVDLSQPLILRWRFESNLTLNLTPAFNSDSIYLPLAGGNLVALRASDGGMRWRAEIGGELSASPVADQERVYVASEIGGEDGSGKRRAAAGTLRALGREGGVTQWVRALATPLRGSLTLEKGKLYAGGSDGKIYAFDGKTGDAQWGYQYSAPSDSTPVVANGHVYIGTEDGSLLALDENSGKLLWRYRTQGPIRGAVATAAAQVFFGSGDGYVYAVNVSDGKLLWRTRTGASVQAVARIGDGLLVASLDNFAYFYSFNGSRVWKRQLPGRISSQPFTTMQGALFTPLSSSAAVVLGLSDGRPVNSLPTNEELTSSASPIGVGNAVYLTTQHGLLAFAHPVNNPERKP